MFVDIDCYGIKPGLYKINEYGVIWSNVVDRPLKTFMNNNGYITIPLQLKNGSRRNMYVHRLVAYYFVNNPNPEFFTIVNHKDENTSNCYYENLEWCDYTYNNNYNNPNKKPIITPIIFISSNKLPPGYCTYGENNGMAKFSEKEVRIICQSIKSDLDNNVKPDYVKALTLANLPVTLNNRYNVSHIARGHRWKNISKDYF